MHWFLVQIKFKGIPQTKPIHLWDYMLTINFHIFVSSVCSNPSLFLFCEVVEKPEQEFPMIDIVVPAMVYFCIWKNIQQHSFPFFWVVWCCQMQQIRWSCLWSFWRVCCSKRLWLSCSSSPVFRAEPASLISMCWCLLIFRSKM